MTKKKRGFTLIELVIVLAVLAIIALIAIPNFNKVRTDSEKKADDATCETIKGVAQMAIADEYFNISSGGGKITITFPSGVKTITTGGGITWNGKVIAPATKKTGELSFEAALKEVVAPQEKAKTSYVITMDGDDSVTSVETK